MSRKKAGMSANAKWGIAFLIEIVVMFFILLCKSKIRQH